MSINKIYPKFLEYLYQRRYAPKTRSKHNTYAQRAILPAVGSILISKLTLHDCAFIERMAQENFKGVYDPIDAMICFRRFCRYLSDNGHELKFSWRDIPVPKRPHIEPDYLTTSEISSIREFLDCSKPAQLRARLLFEILLRGGLRISEALAINIDDINFENESVKVMNCKTKSFSTIHVPGAIVWINKYLKMRSDNSPALFVSCDSKTTSSCRRLPYATAKTYLRKLRLKLNLKKQLTHHIWRRTFCTILLNEGVDIKSVQCVARHASPNTTLRYYVALNKEKAVLKQCAVMSKV